MTLRHVKDRPQGIAAAMAAERLRRRHAPAAEVGKEYKRLVRRPSELATRELLRGVTRDRVEREAYVALVDDVARGLAGDSQDIAVRMLAERVSFLGLAYYHAEALYHRNLADEELDVSSPPMRTLERRADRLGRRLERAIKGLAMVKRTPAEKISKDIRSKYKMVS